MGEWSTRTLEDSMAAIIDYRGKTPQKTSWGIPLVTAKVVKRGRIETPDEFISPDDYDLLHLLCRWYCYVAFVGNE